jgi:ERCC4-related helicase
VGALGAVQAQQKVMSAFRDGKTNVLVATADIGSEGLDFRNCQVGLPMQRMFA